MADLEEMECLHTRHNIWTLEGSEVLPINKTRRFPQQTSQLGPVWIFKVIFNDLMQPGVQFAKICPFMSSSSYVGSWRKTKNFKTPPKMAEVRIIQQVPARMWNLEDLRIPNKRKKSPQVT